MPREDHLPHEHDVASLRQALALKDATLLQMEHLLLLPPPDQRMMNGLSRRAASLVANVRRREMALSLKLQATRVELDAFREREARSVAINQALREQRDAALANADGHALQRQVQLLRSELQAALAREASLQDEVLRLMQRLGRAEGALSRGAALERLMRDDLERVADVALHAMSARAAMALGDSHKTHGSRTLARASSR